MITIIHFDCKKEEEPEYKYTMGNDGVYRFECEACGDTLLIWGVDLGDLKRVEDIETRVRK